MGNDYLMRHNKMLHHYIVNTKNTNTVQLFSTKITIYLKISKNENNWKHI